MDIVFYELKNKKLEKERNVTFEMVIEKMAKGEILLDFEQPSPFFTTTKCKKWLRA